MKELVEEAKVSSSVQNRTTLPSKNRLRVGLLQDGDGHEQILKFQSIGLANEDEEIQFITMNLNEEFESYGKVDVLLQKIQETIPLRFLPENALKIERLDAYMEKHGTVLLDHYLKTDVV